MKRKGFGQDGLDLPSLDQFEKLASLAQAVDVSVLMIARRLALGNEPSDL